MHRNPVKNYRNALKYIQKLPKYSRNYQQCDSRMWENSLHFKVAGSERNLNDYSAMTLPGCCTYAAARCVCKQRQMVRESSLFALRGGLL